MRWPPDAWPWSGSLLLLVAILVAYLVVGFAVASIGIATGHLSQPLDSERNVRFLLLAQIVTYVPIVALLVALLPRLTHRTLHEIGFRAPGARDVGLGLAGAFVMFVATATLSQFLSLLGYKSPEQSVQVFKHLTGGPDLALFIAIAVVFAPIAEELIFRVVVYNAIRRYVPTVGAALLSGAVFGFVHIAPNDASQILPQLISVSVPLLAGGFVLALVYHVTGCYWASVITHAAFNTISVVGILVLHAT